MLKPLKNNIAFISACEALKRKKNEIDISFFAWLCSMLIFLISYLLFNRKPLNIINNVLLLVFFGVSIYRIFKRKLYFLNASSIMLLYFGLWGCISSWLAGVFTYIPMLHSILGLCVYLNIFSEESDVKNAVFVFIIYAFDIFAIAFLVYYIPLFIEGTSMRFGAFFGNQDYVAATLGLCVIFNLYLLSRKNYFSLFFILLGSILEMLTQTRMAFVIIFICVLLFVVMSLWNHKAILIVILACCVPLLFLLIQLPAFEGISKRLVNMFAAIFHGDILKDDSMGPRLSVMLRTYELSLSMPFIGLGYDGIVRYGITTTHDSFGQLSFAAGWIYSSLIHGYVFYKAINLLRKSKKYRYLACFFLVDFTVNFFLGTPFYNRYFFVYMPVVLSISDGYTAHTITPLKPTRIYIG